MAIDDIWLIPGTCGKYDYFVCKRIKIGCVMNFWLASSLRVWWVHGFKPRSGKSKDNKVDICFFSTQQASLRRKRKDRLTRNQIILFEGCGMSTHGLLSHEPAL